MSRIPGMPSRWSIIMVLTVAVVCEGCSETVMLINETESSGVVTYLFQEDRGGPMGSPYRKEALKVMENKCPSGYRVLKDGEVEGYSSMSSVEGQEGDIAGRRWGIQFRCVSRPNH